MRSTSRSQSKSPRPSSAGKDESGSDGSSQSDFAIPGGSSDPPSGLDAPRNYSEAPSTPPMPSFSIFTDPLTPSSSDSPHNPLEHDVTSLDPRTPENGRDAETFILDTPNPGKYVDVEGRSRSSSVVPSSPSLSEFHPGTPSTALGSPGPSNITHGPQSFPRSSPPVFHRIERESLGDPEEPSDVENVPPKVKLGGLPRESGHSRGRLARKRRARYPFSPSAKPEESPESATSPPNNRQRHGSDDRQNM